MAKYDAKILFARNNFWGRTTSAVSSSTDPESYEASFVAFPGQVLLPSVWCWGCSFVAAVPSLADPESYEASCMSAARGQLWFACHLVVRVQFSRRPFVINRSRELRGECCES